MSLVTQCPQCALLFQVPAEQLAATQGQVRCGQCAHAFNGKAFAISPPLTQPLTQPNTAPHPESSLSAGSFTESLSESSAESLLNAPRIDLEALLRRQDVPVTVSAVHDEVPVAKASPALTGISAPPASTEPSAPAATLASPGSPLAAVPPAGNANPSPPALPVRPGALVPSAGPARWIDGLLHGSALLLALSLCFQALVFFKDELVARIPATRPMLESLCVPAVCELAPLRRWNGIVIQSASLVRGDAVYTLNVSLHNAVDVPLAMTTIELTLTDAQDRAVMRRVFFPSDLAAPLALAAGQVWARSFTVESGTLTAEIAGYRLVSFYP
jgi:predicted Zn finger-like uncharacterized protein